MSFLRRNKATMEPPKPINLNPTGEPGERERPPREERPPRPPRTDAAQEAYDKPKPKRPTPADRKLKESIQGFYASMGVLVIATSNGDQDVAAAGNHIANTSEAAADAWMDLANQNPKVKKALQRFSEGTAFAGIVTVHLAMLAPLAAAKGLVPEQYQSAVMMMATAPNMNGSA